MAISWTCQSAKHLPATSAVMPMFRQRQPVGHFLRLRRCAFVPWLFHKAASAGHHHIHVGVAGGIFRVIQDPALAGLRSRPPTRRRHGPASGDSGNARAPANRRWRSTKASTGAADAGGAGAAVGLDHIAIDDNLAFAQFFQVHHAARLRPISRWFLGAALCLPLAASRQCGCRVERQHPYSAVTQPWPAPARKPGTFSTTGGAIARVAETHQHRAFGMAGEVTE